MSRPKPNEIVSTARSRNLELLARLGAEIKASRTRRHWTQAQLGARLGVGRMTIQRMEAGLGGRIAPDVWQAVGLALGRPIRMTLDRDANEEPEDAGHLAIQALLLRFGRGHGYSASFEAASKPSDPARSIDVSWLRDRDRRLFVLEAWNSFGDIGASARSFTRKLGEVDALATARWGTEPHLVTGCWVVRATRRNRALISRYEEIFAARLPGSSAGWVAALTQGGAPPSEPGLVWCDVAATRLFAWRRSGERHATGRGIV